MTAQEIRELDTEALLAKVEEYKKELFALLGSIAPKLIN